MPSSCYYSSERHSPSPKRVRAHRWLGLTNSQTSIEYWKYCLSVVFEIPALRELLVGRLLFFFLPAKLGTEYVTYERGIRMNVGFVSETGGIIQFPSTRHFSRFWCWHFRVVFTCNIFSFCPMPPFTGKKSVVLMYFSEYWIIFNAGRRPKDC